MNKGIFLLMLIVGVISLIPTVLAYNSVYPQLVNSRSESVKGCLGYWKWGATPEYNPPVEYHTFTCDTLSYEGSYAQKITIRTGVRQQSQLCQRVFIPSDAMYVRFATKIITLESSAPKNLCIMFGGDCANFTSLGEPTIECASYFVESGDHAWQVYNFTIPVIDRGQYRHFIFWADNYGASGSVQHTVAFSLDKVEFLNSSGNVISSMQSDEPFPDINHTTMTKDCNYYNHGSYGGYYCETPAVTIPYTAVNVRENAYTTLTPVGALYDGNTSMTHEKSICMNVSDYPASCTSRTDTCRFPDYLFSPNANKYWNWYDFSTSSTMLETNTVRSARGSVLSLPYCILNYSTAEFYYNTTMYLEWDQPISYVPPTTTTTTTTTPTTTTTTPTTTTSPTGFGRDVCFNSTVKCFRDYYGNYSDCYNCASVSGGYCNDGRCIEPVVPSWSGNATTLEIVGDIASGLRNMLAQMGSPIFVILLTVGLATLILFIFGMVLALAKKVGK